MKNLAPL